MVQSVEWSLLALEILLTKPENGEKHEVLGILWKVRKNYKFHMDSEHCH